MFCAGGREGRRAGKKAAKVRVRKVVVDFSVPALLRSYYNIGA